MKLSFSLALMIFFLSGCGRTELNELDIVSAIGVDSTDEGLLVSIQVVNPTGTSSVQSGGSSEGSVYTFSYKGATMTEVLEKIKSSFSRKFFYSHLSLIILGEDLVREKGYLPIVDYVERQYQIRDNVPLFIAEGMRAADILQSYTSVQKIPAIAIKDRIYNNKSAIGLKKGTEFRDVIKGFSEYMQPVIIGVKKMEPNADASNADVLSSIKGNEKAFEIAEIGVFKNTKLVDWLDLKESRGWALANGYMEGPVILSVPCPNDKKGQIGIMLNHVESNLKYIKGSEPLKYSAEVRAKGMIQEVTCKIKVEDPNTIREIEKEAKHMLESEFLAAADKSKEKSADVMGLQQKFYENDHSRWKKMKDQWEELFQNAIIQTDVKVNIKSTGTRTRSVYEHQKE